MYVCVYKNPSIPSNCASSRESLIAVSRLRMRNDMPLQNEEGEQSSRAPVYGVVRTVLIFHTLDLTC